MELKYPKDFINQVIQGDCIDILKLIPSDKVDSIVTDPPAGISYMGKAWDTFADNSGIQKINNTGIFVHKSPPRYTNSDLMAFQDFICQVFTEAIRVLKPGGYALVWAINNTSHHTAMGLERAGFQIKNKIYHIFGSGFPKNRDIWKNDIKPLIEQELKKQGVKEIIWK